MQSFSRRGFVRMAGAACFAGATNQVLSMNTQAADAYPVQLGLVVKVRKGEEPATVLARVRKLGFNNCQMSFDAPSLDNAQPLKRAMAESGVKVTAVMELGPGPKVWDFYHGPLTVGLIPPATRQARIDALKLAADVAQAAGVESIHTHCGFIPENPNDPVYAEAVAAIHEVAVYSKAKGILFLCETGQETPVTLLRMIEDVGLDNMRVNLDTANLILYGKGNPSDAMDVIGKYVHGLHGKDGLFPTNPKSLGREVPIGQGKVDFKDVLRRLKAVNYHGPLTIEREIEGPEQTRDIVASRTYLNKLIAETYTS
jgi:L-ribulose-5-phosphate 3-epimerase